ncbi:nuclear factor 7, ovary-like [Megalops cyprinoides]|uniref:nuclear factor 7, ovary-like n=1 Tax=Megalops cyprinoides TaxID=118141 RepID=UPI001865645D|nr:nuclear factor 7, ovary-like [Megalops cyprinoides]
MAQALAILRPKTQLEWELTCPVCRDIFSDPHLLPCGHAFCHDCLLGMLRHPTEMGFRCPHCRACFGPLIRVQKNVTLANIAEDFKRTQRAKMEAVQCDFCPPGEQAATAKTCLKCEVSMCAEHVKPHLELPAFREHPLTEPLGDVKERKCPEHDRMYRYYCPEAKAYMCSACTQERKHMECLEEASNTLAKEITENMKRHFRTLTEKLEICEGTGRRLKQDLQSLKSEIRKQTSPQQGLTLSITTLLLPLLLGVFLFYVYSSFSNTLQRQHILVSNIYSTISGRDVLTLDIDSASPLLRVSGDLLTAERVQKRLSVPAHPARFDGTPQVLTSQCFTSGRHRWELEAVGYWDIAVSYPGVGRKGKEGTAFGFNKESWSLTHNDRDELLAFHNKVKREISRPLSHNRVTVTVDIPGGNVTFWEAGSALVHLYTFSTTFTQPVCLGLGLYRSDPPSRVTILRS